MKKFEFAKRALSDLREIWEFVSQDSFDGADQLLEEFMKLSNNWLKCREWVTNVTISLIGMFSFGQFTPILSFTNQRDHYASSVSFTVGAT